MAAPLEPSEFLGLVVDRVRLAILGHAAVGRVDAEGLATAMGLDRKRILKEIAALETAGLMIDGALIPEALWEVAAARPGPEEASERVVEGPWDEEETRVLRSFFSGDRLASIPDKHAKRLVVLERLAMEFEPGVRYQEAEVNFRLQMFHPDCAALRRYLVDEGFMSREDGVYWRSGGRLGEP